MDIKQEMIDNVMIEVDTIKRTEELGGNRYVQISLEMCLKDEDPGHETVMDDTCEQVEGVKEADVEMNGLPENRTDTGQTNETVTRSFKCPSCDFHSEDSSTIKEHFTRQHTETVYTCEVCDYRSTKPEDITEHTAVHRSKEYQCGECDYSTATLGPLKAHLKHHWLFHNGQCIYTCVVCKYGTMSKYGYKRHKLRHAGQYNSRDAGWPRHSKPFSCTSCDYKSYIAKNMLRHVQLKHVEVFKCKLCDFTAQSKPDLTIHLCQNHRCCVCRSKFKNPDALKEHVEAKHPEKGFKCKDCCYVTETKLKLKHHSYLHSGHWPNKCEFCDYGTLYPSHLRAHYKARHSLNSSQNKI